MNIFTFISNMMAGTSAALTKTLKAVENCAEMAEHTTEAMLEEQRAESAKRLVDLQSELNLVPSNQKTIAKS